MTLLSLPIDCRSFLLLLLMSLISKVFPLLLMPLGVVILLLMLGVIRRS